MTLLICRTCPRYDTADNGEFRRAVDAEIARNAAADPRTVRHVQCLGGCPEDGVAAVDGPGKTRVRFNGLHAGHADALIRAPRAHAASPTGAPDEWDIPAELATTSAPSPSNAAPSPPPRRRRTTRNRPRTCGEGEPPEPGSGRPTRRASRPPPGSGASAAGRAGGQSRRPPRVEPSFQVGRAM
jgi:predicted metal-binding protein